MGVGADSMDGNHRCWNPDSSDPDLCLVVNCNMDPNPDSDPGYFIFNTKNWRTAKVKEKKSALQPMINLHIL